jgi:hypothetical protein
MPISANQHKENITKLTIATFSDNAAPKMGLANLFPTVTTIEKEIAIEVERNRQLIAVDVRRCTDAKLNTFSNYTEKVFEPPFFNEAFDFTQCRRYNVTFGQQTNPSKADAVSMINETTSNLQALRYKIMRSIELMRSQVLQTGIVTLVNGDSIDFKRKAASIKVLAGAAKWDAPTTSDPLTDFAVGMKFLREEGLSSGSTVNAIFGETAFINFIASTKVKEQAAWIQITRMNINMPQFDEVTGMVFHGQFATSDYNVNIWTYNDFYELPNGAKTRYIDPTNVVMVANDFVGKTGFAGIPAIFNEKNDGGQMIVPVEAEYYVQDYVDQRKKAWMFEIASAPLPIPVSIDRIYTMKTS